MSALELGAGTRVGGLLLLGTLTLTWPLEASAHKVCLDFALGEDLRDASRAGGSMNSCSGQTACPLDELCHCPSASCSCTGEKFETYGRDEGARPYPAMRTLARVLDEESFLAGDPAPVLWGWAMLDDEGCTSDFGADFVTTYRLQYMLWSENPSEQDPARRNYTLGYACNGMPNLGSCEQHLEEIEEITRDGGGITYVARTFGDPDLDPTEAAHYAYWAATFAEFRHGQPELVPLADRRNVYVAIDQPGAVLPGTAAHWVLGGQPTIWAKGDGWRYKFTIAHEVGHVLAQLLRILAYGAAHIDYDGNGHDMTSIEWQAVAAAEGFANAYSMAVWHDLLGGSLPFFYVTPISHGGLAHFNVPASTPRCQQQSCSAGTGNEWDWMTALILFLRDASQPAFAHVLGMNAAAHDDACIGLAQGPCTSAPTCTWSTHADDMCVGWPVSGQSSDYWDAFDDAMQTYLTTPEHDAWLELAGEHEIDQ